MVGVATALIILILDVDFTERMALAKIILWAIGIVGGLLTVAYASAFTPTRYNMFMTAGIALTLGLLFLFILTVNYPYKGEFSVNNRLLLHLPADFDQLDRTALHGESTKLN